MTYTYLYIQLAPAKSQEKSPKIPFSILNEILFSITCVFGDKNRVKPTLYAWYKNLHKQKHIVTSLRAFMIR